MDRDEDKSSEIGSEHTYKCNDCGMVFLNSPELTKHEFSVHVDKLYQCQSCNKIFLDANEFNKHIVIHSVSSSKPGLSDASSNPISLNHGAQRKVKSSLTDNAYNNKYNSNVKNEVEGIPTEYNEEQTLRFLRRQNSVAGEERVKTVADIPIAATLAQVLKDLVFPANKKIIIEFIEQQAVNNPKCYEILPVIQSIDE